jgi:hypothetical protein
MILTCDVVSGYKLFIMTTETEKVDWAQTPCTAFQGARRVASGGLRQVALAVKEVLDNDQGAAVLIFDDITSRLIEVDFRGDTDEVLNRLAQSQENGVSAVPSTLTRGVPQGPGRPKLGVVAREVTLLPRHWDWLNLQPGGASVALRKLVEEARKANSGRDRVRQSQEICYRFMSAMAGDRPGFEEATRALFAGNRERFEAQVQFWPEDIRDHAKKLAEVALGGADGQDAG